VGGAAVMLIGREQLFTDLCWSCLLPHRQISWH